MSTDPSSRTDQAPVDVDSAYDWDPSNPEGCGPIVSAVTARSRPTGSHQDHEDQNGRSGIDGYQYGKEFPEGGRRSHGMSRRDPHGSGRFIPADQATRFWSKVHKIPGGCWVWTGALTRDGYGRFRVTALPGLHRHVKAHRWAWEHLVGPILPGWTLDHLVRPGPCTSRACVRPDHLEPVTRADNARRAAQRRRTTPETPEVTP